MCRVQSSSVGEPKLACCWDVEMEATIVTGWGADVVSIGGVGCPRRAYGRVIVDKGFCSERSKRGFGVIKRPVYFVVRRDARLPSGEPEQVQGEFHLR